MFRRLILFFAVNLFVMLTISVVVSVLGLDRFVVRGGIQYGTLALSCLVWGFAGSLISLALSRFMAKFSYGVRVIEPGRGSPSEETLVRMVHGLASSAGLTVMPEVGIYDSPEMNAFATGPTRSRSLVAVSTGLLRSMDRREVEGVLAHEIAHVANGDMVTMALMQGVVNSFVFFITRLVAITMSRDSKNSRLTQTLLVFLLQIVLSLLGSMLVMWFSRYREFRADAGGAKIGGRENMIAALERLRAGRLLDDDSGSLATMKISGAPKWLHLFSTHPPLEERIARLRATI